MIRRFCDCCGAEITESNTTHSPTSQNALGRLKTTVRSKHGVEPQCKLTVEVIISKDHCGNAGDFCKYCILDALLVADDRPIAKGCE